MSMTFSGEVNNKKCQILKRSHLNAFRRRAFFARVAQNCGEFEFRETSERKLKRHTPRAWWITRETGKPKFLEPPWDKQRDTSCIDFETFLKAAKPLTKWKMISAVKSIYEVLRWSAPFIITAIQ